MMFTCVAITALVFTIDFIFCYENIALNKSTWQKLQYNPGDSRFHSSNAVDGLKTDLSAFGGQCVLTADKQSTATWWVNLTSVVSIHHILIYYRTENEEWGPSNPYTTRFLGFQLYISNTTDRFDGYLCFHDTNHNRSTIPSVANISCPIHGQYVIYYNERLPNATYPSGYSQFAFTDFCEVEVYGCSAPRVYGSNCSIPCPVNCKQYCHVESGNCFQCDPGYKDGHCEQQCNMRKYGEDCSQDCGVCLDYKQCDHINGTCDEGCDSGYYDLLCKTECIPGKYGVNCKDTCSELCTVTNRCNHTSGECEGGCKPGWKGLLCDKECDGGKYGSHCNETCGSCRYLHQCHHINGSCEDGCKPGYQGVKCDNVCSFGYFGSDCKEECSAFCKKTRDCHHVTGSCRESCKAGWQGHDCFQIQAKEESDWQSRFYGLLAGFCVCVAVIAVLLVVVFLQRRRMSGKRAGQSHKESQNPQCNAGYVDVMTTENVRSEYQELSDIKGSSTYDVIK
ncbi:multiple epidermal growth factor-like domains protein 11 [Saccostrea echinata]|uniref:multiple epidermal growth factor-like domains protein 11 n=1 Tax=Saccostrea echinata TaxID=191078 RepID=UPI002A7EA95F|nr:multiple epidermal growth factor-like domains protein 11 [Saccostrea echinata]